MITHTQAVGTNGVLRIQDKTDTPENTVVLWIQGPANIVIDDPNSSDPHDVIHITDIPWSYSIGSTLSPLQSYHWQMTTAYQLVATIYVGYALTFTWHLNDTGCPQLDGPVDFEINLARGSGLKTVSIKDGDSYKRAIPFVKDGGIWKPAAPYVMSNSEWKEAT